MPIVGNAAAKYNERIFLFNTLGVCESSNEIFVRLLGPNGNVSYVVRKIHVIHRGRIMKLVWYKKKSNLFIERRILSLDQC